MGKKHPVVTPEHEDEVCAIFQKSLKVLRDHNGMLTLFYRRGLTTPLRIFVKRLILPSNG